jgi:hypothetical protein
MQREEQKGGLMTAEKREDELTEEELKEQSGEQLPDREARPCL